MADLFDESVEQPPVPAAPPHRVEDVTIPRFVPADPYRPIEGVPVDFYAPNFCRPANS